MLSAPEGPNRDARIKDVFLAAIEMEPAERPEFLARIGEGDAEFLREVERLLAAFEDTGGLFAGTVPGAFFLDRTARQTFSEGDRVGRFTIMRLLGIGGMGEVYEVTDPEFGGRFALKTLRQEYALRADLAARFKREIQLARRVTHPNVCRIYDVGFHRTESGSSGYLTMEMLSGETLSVRLQRGPLELRAALGVLKQIVSGVAALHAAGVVHRDIKPANVILDAAPEGERAVVTDFGVAHPLTGLTDDLTLSGQVVGTVRYMAPEQLTGGKVGPEADVFSLGIVMYEAIRGHQTAVIGSWRDRVTGDLQDWPRTGKSKEGERRLLEIIQRCLAADPAVRFKDASEILTWLERVDARQRWISPGTSPSRGVSTFRQLRAPVGIFLVIGVAGAAWPAARTAVLQRACRVFPGSALVCSLPAERDVAVLPFRVVAGNEADSLLGNGYAHFIRNALSRLYPEPGKQCLHLRNDRTSDGVRLLLDAEIRPRGNEIDFAFTVRDTWAEKGAPSVLRSEKITLTLSSAEQLFEEPARLVAAALGYDRDPALWQAWVARRPHDAVAFAAYLRTLGHLQAGRHEQAVAAVGETLDPAREFQFAPAHAALARAYRMLSNRGANADFGTKARQSAERASALDREFDFGLGERELGEIETGLGHAEEAVRHFSAALRTWPYDDVAVRGLAGAQESLGRKAEAERTLQAAVGRAPRCWLTRNTLADFYSRYSRYEDAERTLLEAVRSTPRNSAIYHNLAFDYIKLGRFPDAVRMASKSVELDPAPLAYSTLGRAYLYENCPVDALVNLKHAVSLDADYYILWANLADAMAAAEKDSAESRRVFERVVEVSGRLLQKTPGHVRGRLQLALNLARLGRHAEASGEIQKVLAASPSGETLLTAAQVYELASRRTEALGVLNRAFDAGLALSQAQSAADLRSLRNDPEYRTLLKRRGIDAKLEIPLAASCPGATRPGQSL